MLSLAALRWLNGGDFVLLPPPSGGGVDYYGQAAVSREDADDRAISLSASVPEKEGEDEEDEEEDGENEDVYEDGDEDDGVDEGEKEAFVDDDDDDEDVDVALKMILNGSGAGDVNNFGNIRPSVRDRRRRRIVGSRLRYFGRVLESKKAI